MFLEKRSRFFRRYVLRFGARSKAAFVIPLVSTPKNYSICDALRFAMRAQKASQTQPNKDTVDLISVDDRDPDVLVLLFHRSSPDAADPAYRKRVQNALTVRQATKEVDEEQAVSAHFIISKKSSSANVYHGALEEIPGLSLSVIQFIISSALNNYKYTFQNRRGLAQETYPTIKTEGLKSESLSEALKRKGSLNYLVLTKTSPSDAPDSDGIAEAQTERIKYRILGDPSSKGWQSKFKLFVGRVRADSWDDVRIDLSMDDERGRTVRIDREAEASEILFVRSEQVHVKKDLDQCTMKVISGLVAAAKNLLSKSA